MAAKKETEAEKNEIAIVEVTEKLLRERIYEIRGVKVMLDADFVYSAS